VGRPLGSLWIAEAQRGIRRVRPNGTITSVDLGSGTCAIQSMAGDATGALYPAVADV
jgi:hypothetical protein